MGFINDRVRKKEVLKWPAVQFFFQLISYQLIQLSIKQAYKRCSFLKNSTTSLSTSVANSGNLLNHGDTMLSHSHMCREDSASRRTYFRCATAFLLQQNNAGQNSRIQDAQIFLLFSINIVYNGTTPGAESPFHACQGCCDPVPPHSTSLLTFCRPDSVTIVNTCCKGIMTAVSPLSWQS